MESMNVQSTKERVLVQGDKAALESQKEEESFSNVENSSDVSVSKIDEENLQQSIQHKPSQEDPTHYDERAEPEEAQSIIVKDEMSDQSSEEIVPKLARSGREQKFKRSTNNSHKKFISVARRWVFKNNPYELKHAFESKYKAFKSTRTYYFIILAFIKAVMTVEKQKIFFAHFQRQVSAKIFQYQRQIENTSMENLKHFRSDEITDLKFSILAAQHYLQGDIDKSIQCVYKKDKTTIVKKQHYEEALKIVKGIQDELELPNSLQDMISIYGSKKPKSKRTEASERRAQRLLKQNSASQQFLLPGIMDIQRALGFSENLFFSQSCPKQPRVTQAERDSCSDNESTEKVNTEQKERKKINNILVIPPKGQVQLNLGWGALLKKPSEVGFRPYNKL